MCEKASENSRETLGASGDRRRRSTRSRPDLERTCERGRASPIRQRDDPVSMVPPAPPFIRVSLVRSLYPPPSGYHADRFVLIVSVSQQQLSLFDVIRHRAGLRWTDAGLTGAMPAAAGRLEARFRRRYVVSTSRFGTGQQSGSNQTPLGLHRIAAKIGAGHPFGTVYESRRPEGFTRQGKPLAAIAHRNLWLEGLEPGFNRGGAVDSHSRYIYIHGLGNEPSLGRPSSRGCIHMAGIDLLPLFDLLPSGTLVWIGW